MILSWGLYLAWPCYSELGFNISHDFSRPRNDPNTNERWPLQFVRLYSTVFCFVSGMYNKSLIMIPHLSNLFLSYLCFSNKREKYLVLKSPSPYLDAIFTLDMIRACRLSCGIKLEHVVCVRSSELHFGKQQRITFQESEIGQSEPRPKLWSAPPALFFLENLETWNNDPIWIPANRAICQSFTGTFVWRLMRKHCKCENANGFGPTKRVPCRARFACWKPAGLYWKQD